MLSKSKIEMKNITILGAGLGGLTAGALLAKKGHKVTILEQHTMVGGCATVFKRKGGFSCEVGLHEMDGVYTNPHIVQIFKELGVYEAIEFLKAPEFFETHTQNGSFLMPDGVENAEDVLIEKFPHETKGIERYFKTIKQIYSSLEKLQNASWYHYALFPFLFWDILFYKPKSVSDILNRLINDDELKQLLNSNVGYYNDTPDSLSFLLHAVAQYSYYSGGGYFIKGGSGNLSEYLAQVVRDNSGEVITKANVVRCSKNYVEYTHKKENKQITSDIIISNISPQQSYALYGIEYNETKPLGDALLSIYLGFSQNLKDVYGKRAYSNFILGEDASEKTLTFVDYSQIDSGLTKDAHKSFGHITLIDNIEEWKNLSEQEYKDKKEDILKSALQRLEKYYPNIIDLVEYTEVGTAKTVERYIKTPNGTAYGFKPTPKEFFRIAKVKSKKVDNLYFVGQWVIAGGFSPSIVSGLLCCAKVIKR